MRAYSYQRRLITSIIRDGMRWKSRPLIGTDYPPLVSQDLRERVLQAYDAGDGGYVTLSRRFRVAESTVYRWVLEYRREGKRAPKVYRHGFVSVLDDDDGAVLRQLVEEQSDATLAEDATRFEARTGW